MVDRPTHAHSLSVDKYNNGEDFDEWANRMEIAVGLAHNVSGDDKKDAREKLCLEWLPLKIDDATWAVYKGATKVTWTELKQELTELLTDPQEKYDWFANRNPIVWDGKESFHALASRIKIKVDKHLTEGKDREYFHRFRGALPIEYRRAIDLGCGDDKWDIE